jgi:hypothetical protein
MVDVAVRFIFNGERACDLATMSLPDIVLNFPATLSARAEAFNTG